jgi:hypothetical protein
MAVSSVIWDLPKLTDPSFSWRMAPGIHTCLGRFPGLGVFLTAFEATRGLRVTVLFFTSVFALGAFRERKPPFLRTSPLFGAAGMGALHEDSDPPKPTAKMIIPEIKSFNMTYSLLEAP